MEGTLVVNADDLGVSRGATLGIIQAHNEGVVTSASLTATTPYYQHALETCVERCPELGIGLHFTLSAGNPVSPPHRVPLLIGRNGFLRRGFGSLFRGVVLEKRAELLKQIEVELEAQLERVIRDGVKPDHINGDRHIHLIPGIFERVVSAARRRDIPYIRMGRDIGWRFFRWKHIDPVLLRGGIIKLSLLSWLARRPRRLDSTSVQTCEYFASYLYSGRLDLIMPDILSRLPAGRATEIMVHPGIPEESVGIELGNRQLERYLVGEGRRAELEACIRVRKFESSVRFCTFRQLSQMRSNHHARTDD